MGCPILKFFQLVLGGFFDFTPDIINKSGEFSQVFLEKDFKFFLIWEYSVIIFDLVLVLLLIKEDSIIEKRSYKRYMFVALSFCYPKMVRVLMTEVVAFYMQVFIILALIPYFKVFVQDIISKILDLQRSKILINVHEYSQELDGISHLEIEQELAQEQERIQDLDRDAEQLVFYSRQEI